MDVISLIILIMGIISFIIMILVFFLFQGSINWLFNIAGVVAALGIALGFIFKAPDSPLGEIGIALCTIVSIIAGLKLFLESLRLLGIIYIKKELKDTGVISLIMGIISFIIMILAFFLFQGCIHWFNIAIVVALLGIVLGFIFKAFGSPLGKIGMPLCSTVCIITGGLRLLGIVQWA